MVDLSMSFCSLYMPYLKLGSTPFARRYLGYRGFFLFLGVLRCFSSPGIPFIRYEFTHECWEFVSAGFPIRKSVDRCVFATPHSFSQLIASFIGSWCQGIHRMLFLTWPYDLFVEIVIFKFKFEDLIYDVLVFWLYMQLSWFKKIESRPICTDDYATCGFIIKGIREVPSLWLLPAGRSLFP